MRFRYDHIHLRSRDLEATAEYYARVFGAQVLRSVQSDGQSRIDLDIDGLTLFLAKVGEGEDVPEAPAEPYLGLDHFGFTVDNLEEAAAELKQRGAEFTVEPFQLRPGVKIAFVLAPENVRIELLERG
jgi:lactoylglutathione lyase